MSNETRHFFGAYAVIKVLPVPVEREMTWCINGHHGTTAFCSRCGMPIRQETVIRLERPTEVWQLLTDDGIDETIVRITPFYLYGTDTIIARSNLNDATVWIEIDRYTGGEPVKTFPDTEQVTTMKRTLDEMPAIQALRQHPAVLDVTIEAGYVEDADY